MRMARTILSILHDFLAAVNQVNGRTALRHSFTLKSSKHCDVLTILRPCVYAVVSGHAIQIGSDRHGDPVDE